MLLQISEWELFSDPTIQNRYPKNTILCTTRSLPSLSDLTTDRVTLTPDVQTGNQSTETKEVNLSRTKVKAAVACLMQVNKYLQRSILSAIITLIDSKGIV